MKKLYFLLLVFIPLFISSQNYVQWNDDFSDGDFTQNPIWGGTSDNFIINSENQLQSNAGTASKSYLSTSSEAFEDASWEFWVRINYNPSQNNYCMVYIISDREDISGEVNGYYVQIGNTADEISLYRQQRGMRTKIIDGTDKMINTNPVIVHIRVTRDKDGIFTLYRKRQSDKQSFNDLDFVQEGTSIKDNYVKGTKYFGVLYTNSSTTGKAYIFDNIAVKGDKFIDVIPPEWTELQILEPNQMKLVFSEPIDFSSAIFQVDNNILHPQSISVSQDKMTVILTFSKAFEKGIIYTLDVQNVSDLAGNNLVNSQKKSGIIETATEGDLKINEILFDHLENAAEYFEVYNHSSKLLDLDKVFFAVRNSTGNFTANNFFPKKSILMPGEYLALTSEPELVKTAYATPEHANIVKPDKWSALNNTRASFLIGNVLDNDTLILDEVRYDVKWHHILVKNTKGVSLERINPEFSSQSPSSWHSAASEVRYGTPGYQNSQFRELAVDAETEKWVWIEPEAFTPDNDGIDDICLIRYKTEIIGFTANVIIFNSVGVKIKEIAQNALLSSEGIFSWDGKTDRGLSVNPGIYVLYFEMINPESGVKKIEKIPLVVSAR